MKTVIRTIPALGSGQLEHDCAMLFALKGFKAVKDYIEEIDSRPILSFRPDLVQQGYDYRHELLEFYKTKKQKLEGLTK